MKISSRLLLLFALMPVALMLTGCAEEEPETSSADDYYWDPEWGPDPRGDQQNVMIGPDGEEIIIQDTAYLVVEKRQAGGELIESGKSKFDGRTLYDRSPLESMIIVEGNQTGQRSAYLLPPEDYTIVQVGHALQESTLDRWESTSENHIPPEEDGPKTLKKRKSALDKGRSSSRSSRRR